MAGLDPNVNVRMMNFSAACLLQKHIDPPLYQPTWDKFVLSANKWLRQQDRKEYDKVDLVNMRGGPDGPTEKILTDLGHKGCLVADMIGILEDAEMHDILQSEEFKAGRQLIHNGAHGQGIDILPQSEAGGHDH